MSDITTLTMEEIWQHLAQMIGPRSFLELSMAEGFASNRRGLRSLVIGISARAWIQKKPASNCPGENTHLCEIFHRLARLLEFPVVPVFVFDGASQASHKRGRESQAAAQQLTSSFRHLVIAFGFNLHVAPAGAEEELAALCRSHLIDIAVTDNISTFVYGAIHVIHDAEFLNSTDDMTRIYTSAMAEAYTGLPRSRGDWILLALLVGNDGGGCGHGLRGCRLPIAWRIIESNLGTTLFEAVEHLSLPDLDQFLKSWRCDLQHQLANQNRVGHQYAQAVGDFPSPHDVIQLIRPITSLSNGQLGPDTSFWVPRIPDLGRLGHLCELLFPWASGPGIARVFDCHVWHGTCNRLLLTSIVFPGDSKLVEHIAAIMTNTMSPDQHISRTCIPSQIQLTISTEPLRKATLSHVLHVRELTAGSSELLPLPEKQILLPSQVVLLALPSVGDCSRAAHSSSLSSLPLFPILREVDLTQSSPTSKSVDSLETENGDNIHMADYTEYLLE